MEVEREGEAQYSKSSERRSKRTTQRHVAAKAKQIKQSLQVSAVPETRFNISNSDVPSASVVMLKYLLCLIVLPMKLCILL